MLISARAVVYCQVNSIACQPLQYRTCIYCGRLFRLSVWQLFVTKVSHRLNIVLFVLYCYHTSLKFQIGYITVDLNTRNLVHCLLKC